MMGTTVKPFIQRWSHAARMVCLTRSPALVSPFGLSSPIAPPLNLAYLAGTLSEQDIPVQIIDPIGENPTRHFPIDFARAHGTGLTWDEIVDRVDPRVDILGISCMFSSSWPADIRLIKKLRARFPEAVIILGGEHVTACADYIMETCPEVDVCAIGEGEETLLQLVQLLQGDEDPSVVNGIVYRDRGEIVRTDPRARMRDINSIPPPAWDLLPLENYLDNGLGHGVMSVRSMPILASRGCPYRCTFCSSPQMWGTRWIARDVNQVVDEMETCIKKYNVQNFDFYDLTAIVKKSWIVEFTNEILRRGLNITYQLPSGTRSEAIDDDVAQLLYRSGCRHMNYAPESGSPETLERIKKKVKLPRLETSLRSACKSGMKVMVNTIVFPDDTGRDVFKTFCFMLRCAWIGVNDITFVNYVPYPGGELYDKLVEQGRLPPLSEEYFHSLLLQSDLTQCKTNNVNISDGLFRILKLLFFGIFYSANYLFRPYRAFINLKNVLLNTPATRTEKVVRQVLNRNIKILSLRLFPSKL